MSNRINDKPALAVVGSGTNFAVDTPEGVKRVTHAVLQVAAAGVANATAGISEAGTVAVTLAGTERLKFVAVTVVRDVAAYTAVLLLPAAKAGDRVVFAITPSGSGAPVTVRFSQFLAGTVLRETVCVAAFVVSCHYDGTNWSLLSDAFAADAVEPPVFAGIQAALTALSGPRRLTVHVLADDEGEENSAGVYVYIPDPVAASLGLTFADNGATIRDTQSGDGWLVKIP